MIQNQVAKTAVVKVVVVVAAVVLIKIKNNS